MTTETVHIRRARPGDADGIALIHVDAWRTAYPGLLPAAVLLRLSRPAQTRDWSHQIAQQRCGSEILVAESVAGGIIGFGSCGRARPTGLAPAGEVFTLYVAPDSQDQGVGRALLAGLFGALLDRGLASAIVWVLSANPARFFYERMGGRRVAERDELLWNTRLAQTAYAWDDLRLPGRG